MSGAVGVLVYNNVAVAYSRIVTNGLNATGGGVGSITAKAGLAILRQLRDGAVTATFDTAPAVPLSHRVTRRPLHACAACQWILLPACVGEQLA